LDKLRAELGIVIEADGADPWTFLDTATKECAKIEVNRLLPLIGAKQDNITLRRDDFEGRDASLEELIPDIEFTDLPGFLVKFHPGSDVRTKKFRLPQSPNFFV